MNTKNKLILSFMHLITVLFTVIMSGLTVMSLLWHCKVDINTYHQTRNIEAHRPVIYAGLGFFVILLLLFVCHLLTTLLAKARQQWRIVYIALAMCLTVTVAASIFWILFNDCTPKNDQATLFAEARILAGYADGEHNSEYFTLFPRNKGLVLIMSAALRLFGDTQISFRILNVFGAVLLFISVCLTTKRAWDHAGVTLLTALLLSLFYPIVIYTAFLYGTLLSAAFASCGIYGIVRFCECKDWKSVLLSAISFPIAMQMHQSAAIALIAALIYLLIHFSKKDLLKIAVYAASTFMLIVVLGKVADYGYERITGIQMGDSVPSAAWIYMGLTSENEDGGPGAQDGSFYQLFAENDHDSQAASKDAVARIITVVNEYLGGKRDLSFFLKKAQYQWLDPTFGARKTIAVNDVAGGEPVHSDAYTAFYHSGIRDLIFKLSIVYMIIIYSLSLFTGYRQLSKDRAYHLHFLVQILLIGGFVFQLMWESLSRYCFPYFIWLIPEAAFGLTEIYNMLAAQIRNKACRCRTLKNH